MGNGARYAGHGVPAGGGVGVKGGGGGGGYGDCGTGSVTEESGGKGGGDVDEGVTIKGYVPATSGLAARKREGEAELVVRHIL